MSERYSEAEEAENEAIKAEADAKAAAEAAKNPVLEALQR